VGFQAGGRSIATGSHPAVGGKCVSGQQSKEKRMSEKTPWTCPHCFRDQIVTNDNSVAYDRKLYLTKLDIGDVGVQVLAISCLNPVCHRLTLHAFLQQASFVNNNWKLGDVLKRWNLLPESQAKPQPDYIPHPLREDYIEACRIRDLSPKASATLARRCLQGMIRDFCGISRGTLDKEITSLKEAVDQDKAPRGVTPESVDAIDHVRKIGNIGAHMEKDIDLIIEIDPDEAQLLIELVETLFEEWYVAREQRQQRFAGIAALRIEKDAAKKLG
jgi:hypothetical protein